MGGFSARARLFFFFFLFFTCTNRMFHADPFPLLAPRGECFCPECCLFPAPEGSKSCFVPSVEEGGLFHARILEESLRDPGVPCAEVEPWPLMNRIGPRKEIIILYTIFTPEKREEFCTLLCFLTPSCAIFFYVVVVSLDPGPLRAEICLPSLTPE